MKNLTVLNNNGQTVVNSREVAEMIEKEHKNLIRDIRGYIEIIDNNPSSKLSADKFFIESTYFDSQSQERPCYLLTKKGCDMVANKMTGEKGILFTAAYVTKFEEMEISLKSKFDTSNLPPHLQALAMLTQQAIEVEKKLIDIKAELKLDVSKVEDKLNKSIEILAQEVKTDWKDTINNKINSICARCNMSYQKFRGDLYAELEQVASCNLSTRQTHLRERLRRAGSTYKEMIAITKIHVIEKDNHLKQIFENIVNKHVLKYAD